MKLLGQVLKLAETFLLQKKIASPRREAEILLAELLHIKRLDLYLQFDRPLEEKEVVDFRNLILERATGKPIPYIFGKMEFCDLTLEINSHVLIPRQETEILLHLVCKRLEKENLQGKILFDLCSGSGCLGLGVKKRFPQLDVYLSDLSESALSLAKKNGEKNDIEVTFLQGDLLMPFKGKKANIVFCNPPYLSFSDFEKLDKEVKDFEPSSALLAGESGVEFYERLSKELPDYLHPNAQIFFEIGTGQGEKVKNFFTNSEWKNPTVEKDWAGHDRFFSAIFLETS
ncbi:MAG: peptide chain release factor N(5)-glutamine methyltransferase [Chlamydiae bacterium]|nr:peptide chain release factor N(5)-glutamine methyltransferase [Chlamydiota bacterium]